MRVKHATNLQVGASMVVIFWRGLGFLVAVIVFGCSLIANLIFNLAVGDGYYDSHPWPFAISLLVSAAMCWVLSSYLRKRSARTVIDQTTGQEVTVYDSQHSLFFIPMHWW